MKRLIKYDIGNYQFNATAKTIIFSGISIKQEQILTITNITDTTMIYCFADSTLGGTFDDARQTLTLEYDTSGMLDTDVLQIYVDIPDKNIQGNIVQQMQIGDAVLWQNPTTGEIYTEDVNMAAIFGRMQLVDAGKLRVKAIFDDTIITGRLGVAQEALGIDCKGCPSVTVQLSGTWASTVTFEGRADVGTYVVVNGMAVNGTNPVTTSTANGIFRFNTSGLIWFQIRISAYTSGTISATLSASGEPGPTMLTNPVSGSQSQPITQRATTYEANTYDTNLAVVLGTSAVYRLGFTAAEQIVAPTVNPTQPTAYAGPMYSRYPQLFPRVRVETGGDQKLPYAQEYATNRILVATPELYSKLEEVLFQLKTLNQLTMGINGIEPPVGWEEIK